MEQLPNTEFQRKVSVLLKLQRLKYSQVIFSSFSLILICHSSTCSKELTKASLTPGGCFPHAKLCWAKPRCADRSCAGLC